MSRFFDKKFEGLKAYIPGEQPKNLGELIKLNTNECPFPPSPAVLEAISAAEVLKLRLYPDPTCSSLCNTAADYFGVEPNQICFGNGSDELLAFCFHAFCEKGAAFADITYGFYKVFCSMFGVKSDIIRLRSDYSISVDDYSQCRGTLFIANPNAPTGMYLSLAEVEILLRQNKDRLVVVDEAYIDFGGKSAVKLISNYDNLIVIGTFSKSRQLAGGRLGYAISNPEIIGELNTMRFSFNPYNVNRLTLLAAEAAIRDDKYFEFCKKIIMENREFVSGELEYLGFTVLPSLSNFIFISNKEILSGKEYYQALKERNILVRYFDEDRLQDFVRITIGTSEEMDTLLDATREILGIEEVADL